MRRSRGRNARKSSPVISRTSRASRTKGSSPLPVRVERGALLRVEPGDAIRVGEDPPPDPRGPRGAEKPEAVPKSRAGGDRIPRSHDRELLRLVRRLLRADDRKGGTMSTLGRLLIA